MMRADGPSASATTKPAAPRFNLAAAERAQAEWGANCGPGALAAMFHLTLDEVRPHMGDFERKGYTNPTMMISALESLGARFHARALATNVNFLDWPSYGLARIQWEGPWSNAANPRWGYRYSHWVGAARINGEIGVFDINCINNGSGWVSLHVWQTVVVPWILIECVPRASGGWHITHAIEVKQQ